MKYTKWLKDNWQKDNIFPPPLKPQKAIEFLVDYLLGEDWYSTIPGNSDTINAEIVDDILTKYSIKYRVEKKLRRIK